MKKKTGKANKGRFSIRLDDEWKVEIEKARSITGKGSAAEVLREAFSVYFSILTANERNVRFSFEDRDSGEKGYLWLLPGPAPFKK
jgi:hypothetical protein